MPLKDEAALFRLLMLEGQQAGLSWITVLNKREHMDHVFWDFDLKKLAEASAAHLETWLCDPGLIRHRGKLEALVANAQLALTIKISLSGFGLCRAGGIIPAYQVPAETPESRNMSKALKKPDSDLSARPFVTPLCKVPAWLTTTILHAGVSNIAISW